MDRENGLRDSSVLARARRSRARGSAETRVVQTILHPTGGQCRGDPVGRPGGAAHAGPRRRVMWDHRARWHGDLRRWNRRCQVRGGMTETTWTLRGRTTTGSTLTRRCAPASPWQGEASLCCFVGDRRQRSVRLLHRANPIGRQCRGDPVGRPLGAARALGPRWLMRGRSAQRCQGDAPRRPYMPCVQPRALCQPPSQPACTPVVGAVREPPLRRPAMSVERGSAALCVRLFSGARHRRGPRKTAWCVSRRKPRHRPPTRQEVWPDPEQTMFDRRSTGDACRFSRLPWGCRQRQAHWGPSGDVRTRFDERFWRGRPGTTCWRQP